MEKSEKNFLERFADAIPGLSGYRSKEDRRTTDKRLRDYMASRLDRLRDRIGALKLELTNQGKIASLNDVGLLDRKLQTLTETIRFSSYGYSGFFDQLKIKEEQLDTLYAHDLKILEAVEKLEKALGRTDASVKEALAQVDGLEELLLARKTLWDGPGQ